MRGFWGAKLKLAEVFPMDREIQEIISGMPAFTEPTQEWRRIQPAGEDNNSRMRPELLDQDHSISVDALLREEPDEEDDEEEHEDGEQDDDADEGYSD
jgi:hypothetical protein